MRKLNIHADRSNKGGSMKTASILKQGDFVKLRGWKKMKKIVEIIDRGSGWVAAMVGNGRDVEYTVIEDWKIESIGRMKQWWK